MLYPPILSSTQPVYTLEEAKRNGFLIHFSLSQLNDFSEVKHIQVRIVNQSNNQNLVGNSVFPDKIIYLESSEAIEDGEQYVITIDNKTITGKDTNDKSPWKNGYLYKVQLRFGSSNLWGETGQSFPDWKADQIENSTFSEWSTVMVVKFITEPTVSIIVPTKESQKITTPLFKGRYKQANDNSKEILNKYRFTLTKDGNEIETSDWILYNWKQEGTSSIVSYRFNNLLQLNTQYVVKFEIESINGLKREAETTYVAIQSSTEVLSKITLQLVDSTPYCRENGCIQLKLNASENKSGTYVLTRTSELSNYSFYEDLYTFKIENQELNDYICYTDFTIESGVKYQYALQKISDNNSEVRSKQLLSSQEYAMVHFNYSYLYCNGIQLRLQFNQKMSSYKITTLRSKQDTIGAKYPYLIQNGSAYYSEFPITGLITFAMDSDATFLKEDSNGFFYCGDLVLARDRLSSGLGKRGELVNLPRLIDTNSDGRNLFVERKFREKVIEFLNDFGYKLYKSPTEGNTVVGLMNVSFTPVENLGRMVYEFSATAYEIGEKDLTGLKECGIIE